MSENESVMENVQPVQPSEPTRGQKVKAAIKEWCRKFIVKLKYKTHLIPLVFLLITTFIFLCMLNPLSIVVDKNRGLSSVGIAIFINTLVSVLILVVFLNAFPKRKKPNIVMIAAVFALLGLLIGMDVMIYVNVMNFAKKAGSGSAELYFSVATYIKPALNQIIVHIVFLGINVVLLALLPLYKKGIMKINTKKALESNQIKEEIDVED